MSRPVSSSRRHTVTAIWLIAAALQSAPMLQAEAAGSYPSHPVRMIIPSGAGGITDILGRVIAPKLGEGLGQQVVVDNRPGASGVVGSSIVAKETADGGAGSARLDAWMRPGSGL